VAERAGLTVYIVDDDASVRDSLGLLLGLRGYRCAPFASAEAFLDGLRPEWRGCLLADLRMPGIDGLQLQQELARREHPLPIVIVTGHGDVTAARTAFIRQAVDFIEKPFDDDSVIAAIETAFRKEEQRLDARAERELRRAALAALTEREREVAALLVRGLHNRDVARKLGISPRTVEVHKARVMSKLNARGTGRPDPHLRRDRPARMRAGPYGPARISQRGAGGYGAGHDLDR
jgi:RNA polymerase sigma factor (sigma-70 family)